MCHAMHSMVVPALQWFPGISTRGVLRHWCPQALKPGRCCLSGCTPCGPRCLQHHELRVCAGLHLHCMSSCNWLAGYTVRIRTCPYSAHGASCHQVFLSPHVCAHNQQIRQAVTEFAILPLGSQVVHSRLPHIKSLLLYGAPHTGKTMLAHVRRAGCLQQPVPGADGFRIAAIVSTMGVMDLSI